MIGFILSALLVSVSFAGDLNNIVIIHSKHEKQSREFILANPSYQVVSWYEDSNTPERVKYLSQDMPVVSQFPSVVDTKSKLISVRPSTMADALLEITKNKNDIESKKTEEISLGVATKNELKALDGFDKEIDKSSLEAWHKKLLNVLLKEVTKNSASIGVKKL